MLTDDAGERVADEPLQERGELSVAGHDGVEEREPRGTLCCAVVDNGRKLRDQVLTPVWTQLTGAKIDGAVSDVQEPWIGVHGLRQQRDLPFALRQVDHGFTSIA